MSTIARLTFIDIETTALNVPRECRDSIIEVAAAIVNLQTREIVDQYECLICPHGTQTRYVSEPLDSVGPTNRLTWDLGPFHGNQFEGVDWSEGRTLLEALNKLAQDFMYDGAIIAGQNPAWDLVHLRRDFAAVGLQWPDLDYHVFDLGGPALFLQMAGLVPGLSLRHTAKWAGCTRSPHRAMNDVLNAIDVFWAMHDHFLGIPHVERTYFDGDIPIAMNEGCPEIDLSEYQDPLLKIPPEGFVS